MKTKKLTPRNSAPVQRENAATVSRDGWWGGNGVAPSTMVGTKYERWYPFAGDDAE